MHVRSCKKICGVDFFNFSISILFLFKQNLRHIFFLILPGSSSVYIDIFKNIKSVGHRLSF